MLCFLLGQLRNTHESMDVLCRRESPQSAYIVLRSLQECYIRIYYILREEEKEVPVDRAREWIGYDVIERRKTLDSIGKGKGINSEVKDRWLEQKDDILRSCEEIKKRGKALASKVDKVPMRRSQFAR